MLLLVVVESLEELQEAVDSGGKRILLDNFSPAWMRAAVAAKPADVELEASGNITLETIREVAETGVDYISVGALSKHLRAVDFSLLFVLDENSYG